MAETVGGAAPLCCPWCDVVIHGRAALLRGQLIRIAWSRLFAQKIAVVTNYEFNRNFAKIAV
jgi:hypothetical protein